MSVEEGIRRVERAIGTSLTLVDELPTVPVVFTCATIPGDRSTVKDICRRCEITLYHQGNIPSNFAPHCIGCTDWLQRAGQIS